MVFGINQLLWNKHRISHTELTTMTLFLFVVFRFEKSLFEIVQRTQRDTGRKTVQKSVWWANKALQKLIWSLPIRPIFIPQRASARRADWAPGPGVLVLLPPVARSLIWRAVMPSSWFKTTKLRMYFATAKNKEIMNNFDNSMLS